jgi:hypothetical protein
MPKVAPAAALTGLMLYVLAAYAAPPFAPALTQQALGSGFLTRLPPEISVAFGLAKAADGSDVRQLISKEGHQVRTFNVSVANHADLVIFNLNAQTGASVAYLLGPDGLLRKAVSYQSGAAVQELGAAHARAGFARETRFWAARARHAAAPPSQ